MKGLDKVKEESMENQAEQSMEDCRKAEFSKIEGEQIIEVRHDRGNRRITFRLSNGKMFIVHTYVEVSPNCGLLVHLGTDDKGSWATLGGSNE